MPPTRLIDDLWGESPPDSARSALQVYVAGLRKALGSDGEAPLRTRAPGYVLEVEPDALDLARFARVALGGAGVRPTRNDGRHSSTRRSRSGATVLLAELKSEPFSLTAVAQLEELS